MKVGDVIKPKKDKSGAHWAEKKPFEKAMETFRKEKYPDAPSRVNAIFCSIIPRSRFKDKGYLYVVKPLGKMLMTNSYLIDLLEETFDKDYFNEIDRKYGYKNYEIGRKYLDEHPVQLRYLLDSWGADRYWNGKNIGDKESTEVICESAIVTEVIDTKNKDLFLGDKIEITEDDKVHVNTTIYFEKSGDIEKYENKDKDIINFINKFKILYKDPKEELSKYDKKYGGGGNLKISGFLKRGTKLKILVTNSDLKHSRKNREGYKYTRIMFSTIFKEKLLRYTMDYFYSYTNNIRDVSKYFKKL